MKTSTAVVFAFSCNSLLQVIQVCSSTRPDVVYQGLHDAMTIDELNYYFGVSDPADAPEYEVVTLSDPADRPDCTFFAFGRSVNLFLEPNDRLISDNFVWKIRDDSESVTYQEKSPRRCHYMHRISHTGDAGVTAAFTYCPGSSKNGIVFLPDVTYELQSISAGLCRSRCDHDGENAFILKRAPTINHTWTDGFDVLRRPGENYAFMSPDIFVEDTNYDEDGTAAAVAAETAIPVLETALYFDEPAYKTFLEYFKHDDEHLADMILAYVNAVQVLYHHPSLGKKIEIVLVKLEMFKTQPTDLPHYGGERSLLLDSFCAFNKKYRKQEQWDIGLYISGLDFYSMENGHWSGSTMGLATVGGICSEKYSCIIAEFGSTDALGKPYPSAGFTSVYILAHEIGHSLGMHHDGNTNDCPKEGFIMSPSRGITGELLWSECSARVAANINNFECLFKQSSSRQLTTVQKLNHNKFADKPGQAWDAKKQCELLLLDNDARVMNTETNLDSSRQQPEDICENLQCETPNRPGYYFAGPALEGTTCGPSSWCEAGKCVKGKPKKPKKIIKGGWSQWKVHECTSGCIHKSKGFRSRTRTCNNPKPINTNEGCEGPKQEAVLCKDDKTCQKSKKITAAEYATAKCKELASILPVLDKEYSGLQAPHEDARSWMGCSVFCRRKDTGSFYTPRLDVSNLPVDPYFPDGTWCHAVDNNNYYCLNHVCTPEYDLKRSGKSSADTGGDFPMISQNARPPGPYVVPEVLLRYLSVGADGTPLLTTITPDMVDRTDYGDWSNDDYVDMPDRPLEQRMQYAINMR
ncbi:A disintegrin and metalloproteinase with thrombospondin motifs adt-2-like [Rhopalosiphum padi]|uniref:A disintegrin and metalloproteinase with thrombospondin motifs adt-2-like n=1 Tax=Rhopalosiphum padi TaxID=40932 RepID=UPI00298DA4D6|nr:A disintegrin and metalloproteinase with thrombospondin motifs adt-2-like [Rhopalosiphum padi]